MKYLVLDTNEFTDIPKEIGNLKNLIQLTLGYTRLRELPKEIGNLKNLIRLSIQNADLRELPEEIINLTNLKLFEIFDNKNISYTQQQDLWIEELEKNNCTVNLLDRPGF